MTVPSPWARRQSANCSPYAAQTVHNEARARRKNLRPRWGLQVSSPNLSPPSPAELHSTHPLAVSEIMTSDLRGEVGGWGVGSIHRPRRSPADVILHPGSAAVHSAVAGRAGQSVRWAIRLARRQASDLQLRRPGYPVSGWSDPIALARLRPHSNAEYPLRGRSLATPLFASGPALSHRR